MTSANELIKHWREAGPIAWAEGPYGWIDIDARPITLTPWQRAVLSAWWDYRDVCTTLAISNVKKTGKTLINAVLLAWRWLALPGEHYAVGNDFDQAAGRQFQQVSEMVKRNSYLTANCRLTRDRITFTPTGSTIVALAVDAAGNAGANHLTVSHTEAWGIVYEAGRRAYEELAPPPGKFFGLPALRICDSYAGFEGESDTWHNLVDRGLKGKPISDQWGIYVIGGLVLFHMAGEEARERCFRGTPQEAIAYYSEQRADLRALAWNRQHENTRTGNESQFLPDGAWEACYSPAVRPLAIGDLRRAVFAADASTSRDLTALTGCIYDPKSAVVDAVYAKVWTPIRGVLRLGKPTVDIDETLGAEVERLHRARQISAIVADPYQLHTSILKWEKMGIKVYELAQNAGRVESDQALYDAVIARTIRHFDHPVLNEHVKNAVAIESVRGYRLAKDKTSKKIDLIVSLSMSHWGSLQENTQAGSMEAIDDPFLYHGAELSPDYDPETAPKFIDGKWRPATWSTKPHPPGVTLENCKFHMGGCSACEAEWDARPEVQAEREFWKHKIPMSQQEFELEMMSARGGYSRPEPQVDTSIFWNNVRRRMKDGD